MPGANHAVLGPSSFPFGIFGEPWAERTMDLVMGAPSRGDTVVGNDVWLGHRVLVIRYRDSRGSPSRREVEPHLLARSGRHWFLVAWCRERQALRWFREDRIESAEITGETAPKRDLTDLGAPPVDAHPAGRALDRAPAPAPPRLVVLPGGRA